MNIMTVRYTVFLFIAVTGALKMILMWPIIMGTLIRVDLVRYFCTF